MEPAKKFSEKFAADFSKPFERVMVFVDGAYLRKHCKDFWGSDKIKWGKLSWTFIRMFNTYGENPFNANLIRIYYYDAIVPETDADFIGQKEYFENISCNYAYTVRLGIVKRSSRREDRQKGVDILMTVDALTKAYEHHYETGMFLLGDGDFKPLVEAVKDAGKKTIGIYYPPTCSRDLVRTFDMRIFLDKNAFKNFLE
jgi:uncharacterized LabA/DUF88 family protein